MVCPLCGSDASRIICDCNNVPPWPNALAGLIYECKDCRFIYKETTQRPLSTLHEVYQYTIEETSTYLGPTLKGYQVESAEIRLYSRVLREICQRLDNTTDHQRRLLDVGCGTGALLDRSRAFGFLPFGVELNPYYANYAREVFDLPIVSGELSLDHFGPETFDAVTMMDLIEHVPDPLLLLNTAWQLLKPGGVLVVYTPNHRSVIAQLALRLCRTTAGHLCQPAHVIFGTLHVCFFDHRTLRMALERIGFVVDTVQRLKYDIEHEGEVSNRPVLATGIKVLEMLTQLVGLPYRLLVAARKPVSIISYGEVAIGNQQDIG